MSANTHADSHGKWEWKKCFNIIYRHFAMNNMMLKFNGVTYNNVMFNNVNKYQSTDGSIGRNPWKSCFDIFLSIFDEWIDGRNSIWIDLLMNILKFHWIFVRIWNN